MLSVSLDNAIELSKQYTRDDELLNERQPLSVIHRTFRDGHKTMECLPTWLAEITMQGLAAGNEPLVASARIVTGWK